MITRRGVLVGAGAALVAAPVVRAQAPDDAALLRGAVDLENLSIAAYTAATAAGTLAGDAAALTATITIHERQHLDLLAVHLDRLGQQPPAQPADPAAADALAVRLGLEALTGALDSGPAFLAWAERLELRTVAVYVDAARRAVDVGLLQALLAILGSEGQQLAAVRDALGRPPIDEAFEAGA